MARNATRITDARAWAAAHFRSSASAVLAGFAVAALLLGVTAAPLAAAGGAQTTTVAPRQTLVIGVEAQDYLPFFGTENGIFSGYFRDLATAYFEAAGFQPEFRPRPVPELYAELLRGGIDVKFPDNPKWQAEMKDGATITYSAPVETVVDVYLVPAESKTLLRDDIKRIAHIEGFSLRGFERQLALRRVASLPFSSVTDVLRAVLAGRADAAYMELAVARSALRRMGVERDRLIPGEALPVFHSVYHMSSRTEVKAMQEFGDWLGANTELVTALRFKYGLR